MVFCSVDWYKKVIFKHDASRIIQCCLKYGSPKQRDAIAAELKGHYTELSKSQYGRFIVSKILNYCSPQYRNDVITEFYGKVRKLIRHKEASQVLEEAYSQFANASQRSALMEEFYGPEFALFKSKDTKNIQDVLASNPAKKESIVRHLKEVVYSILEKGTCNIGQISIIHRAILEYMTYSEDKAIQDLIEVLKDHLVHILHTREGCRVAQLCLLNSTPKNRKHIIKSLKGFMTKVAREQYGHAVLITIFETVDDTVLVQKAVLGEMVKDEPASPEESFAHLLRNKYASRVFLFLLSGRNRKYQPAYLVNELEEMDAVRSKTSKKDDVLRKQELKDAVTVPLMNAFEKNSNTLLRDKAAGQVLIELIKNVTGGVPFSRPKTHLLADKSSLFEALTAVTVDAPDESAPTESAAPEKAFNAVRNLKNEADKALLEETLIMDDHILANRNATMTLKTILSGNRTGKDTTEAGNAEFAAALFKTIQPHLSKWINYCASEPMRTSGTSFVLLNIFESGDEWLKSEIRKSMAEILKQKSQLEELIKTKKESQLTSKPLGKKRKQGQEDALEVKDRKTGIEHFIQAMI